MCSGRAVQGASRIWFENLYGVLKNGEQHSYVQRIHCRWLIVFQSVQHLHMALIANGSRSVPFVEEWGATLLCSTDSLLMADSDLITAELVRMVKLKVKTLFSISNATDAENKLGGKIRTNLIIWMPNWFYIILLACWLSIGFTYIELMELWKDGWIINIILTRQFS
jgi:hypothetical protein